MDLTSAFPSADRDRRSSGPAPAGAAARTPTPLDDARDLLARHTADEYGMCAGCRSLWNRLVPHPCTQVDWARATIDRVPTPETTAALGLPEPPA